MRIVSKTQTKTTLLALLTCLIFSFFACSQLEPKSSRTGSVSFNLNAAREVTSDAGTLVDIELRGDYEASQTVTLSADKKTSVTFEDVPVGKNVSVYVQVYTPYDGAKSVKYFGESESKKITSGNNDFTVPLTTAYNSIAKGNSSCLILNPLFTSEATNKTLTSNRLDFNSNSETFYFMINTLVKEESLVLDEYQKAILTIKGTGDSEHSIRTKFVKSSSAAMYYQTPVTVSAERKTYEMIIPQGIKLDAIGFENSWDNDPNDWASDYSFVIEKIELKKDSSLIDPDFNVATKTSTTYVVKNPALQTIVYTNIDKNKITFDTQKAKEMKPDDPYSAAYWEFENLAKYDKATITVRCDNPNSVGMNFVVKGFIPQNIVAGTTEVHSSSSKECTTTTLSFDLEEINSEGTAITALEFQNNSLIDGTWTNPGDNWTLEIVEIKLERTALTGNVNIYINQSGEEYNRYTYSAGSEERPFKYVSDAFEKIKAQGTNETEWTILIDGEATGKPLGTSGTNRNYGHVEIPAEVTSDVAKSILITGATPHGDWLEGTVPSDLDTINRGSTGANTSLSSGETINGAAIVVNTGVPVTITNLKITGGSGYNGGGIVINEGATVSLGDGVLIIKNRGSNRGGAICNVGRLFIYGSALIGDKDANNFADTSSTQNLSSTSTSNYANSGGGIFNGDPSSTSKIAELYLGYKPSETDLSPVEEPFSGGIYCNGAKSGGGIYNNTDSKIYYSSGTLSRNCATESGGGIFNDWGLLKMSGGDIHTNKVSQSSGIVRGGGINNHGTGSKFIMSGGSIYKNIAWSADSGATTDGEGGGVYNGGYMFMYGSAVIGEDPTQMETPSFDPADSTNCSNKANIGGGIYNSTETDTVGRLYIGYMPSDSNYTIPEATEFSGGIYYNYSEIVRSTDKKGGGGIYSASNNAYGEFKMSSGTIAYNSTNDYGGGIWGEIVKLNGAYNGISIHDNTSEKTGNAFYMDGNSRYYLEMSGSIDIEKGENNYHDIYLGGSGSNTSHIQITNDLDGNLESIITPESYEANNQLVKADDGVNLEAECKCFSVTLPTKTITNEWSDTGEIMPFWIISSEGKLSKVFNMQVTMDSDGNASFVPEYPNGTAVVVFSDIIWSIDDGEEYTITFPGSKDILRDDLSAGTHVIKLQAKTEDDDIYEFFFDYNL